MSNSPPDPSPSSPMWRAYKEAISVDIHVLKLLLERNYHQQHRCLYFRRLSMVSLALKRLFGPAPSLPLLDEVATYAARFQRLCIQLLDQYSGTIPSASKQGIGSSSRKRPRQNKEEHWVLDRDGSQNTSRLKFKHEESGNDEEIDNPFQRLPEYIQKLRKITTESLPQVISRIYHATSPLIHELSSGRFVPFVTVALGCLGRIHTLLLRMGRELVGGAGGLRELVPALRFLLQDNTAKRPLENDGLDVEALGRSVFPPFAVCNSSKNESKISSTANSSQEWNVLMGQYLEVSHDELLKQTNAFVRRVRWEDMIRSFGLKKTSFKTGNGYDDLGLPSEGQSTEAMGEETKNIEEISSSLPLSSATGSSLGEDIMDVDAGELIDGSFVSTTTDGSQNVSIQHNVDDNMARILKRAKGKRQAETNEPNAKKMSTDGALDIVSATSKKKKKKKKRKKEKQEETMQLSDNGEDGGLEPREKFSLINDSFKGDSKSVTSSTESARNMKSMDEEVNTTKLNHEDASVTTPKPGNETPIAPSSTGNVGNLATPDSLCVNNSQKSKEKKRKSSSKKSKKRRSNVIDDIFGF